MRPGLGGGDESGRVPAYRTSGRRRKRRVGRLSSMIREWAHQQAPQIDREQDV